MTDIDTVLRAMARSMVRVEASPEFIRGMEDHYVNKLLSALTAAKLLGWDLQPIQATGED
jgi:hypothetical protein